MLIEISMDIHHLLYKITKYCMILYVSITYNLHSITMISSEMHMVGSVGHGISAPATKMRRIRKTCANHQPGRNTKTWQIVCSCNQPFSEGFGCGCGCGCRPWWRWHSENECVKATSWWCHRAAVQIVKTLHRRRDERKFTGPQLPRTSVDQGNERELPQGVNVNN